MKIPEEAVVINEGDSFKTVLSKYGALALDKQENLSELIGNEEGSLDLENATITFNNITLPIQVIGYYREDIQQWVWAWDSEDLFGDDLIKAAKEMKQAGIDAGIPEFSNAIIQADFNACHTLAMTTTSIIDLDAYYAVNEEGLDIFVGINKGNVPEINSVEKFRDTYYTFQKNFDVYEKLAFKSYTKLKGYKYKEKEDFSVAYLGESRIIVGFTERGNTTHIQMLLEDE